MDLCRDPFTLIRTPLEEAVRALEAHGVEMLAYYDAIAAVFAKIDPNAAHCRIVITLIAGQPPTTSAVATSPTRCMLSFDTRSKVSSGVWWYGR